MPNSPEPSEISQSVAALIKYSFCTLVTNIAEYREMIAGLPAKGFTQADCELLYLDNSQENRFDAYAGYNRFLQAARGEYIVLCHQDIVLIDDGRAELDALLADLTRRDPDWAVCGNAGATASGGYAVRITDPRSSDMRVGGPFPAPVISVDENFIIVRREANLALSHDLTGYHWYGSDICIVADILGWTSYVIDFHLRHKSGGTPNADFHAKGQALSRKYARAFRPRWQHVVTWNAVYLSASPVERHLAETARTLRRTLGRLRRRLVRL